MIAHDDGAEALKGMTLRPGSLARINGRSVRAKADGTVVPDDGEDEFTPADALAVARVTRQGS